MFFIGDLFDRRFSYQSSILFERKVAQSCADLKYALTFFYIKANDCNSNWSKYDVQKW